MENREIKRKRAETLDDYEPWPRFIILTSKESDKPLTKLSPFLIEKAITGIAGSPKNVKKLRSGQILIECEKKAHSVNILKTTKMADIKIEAKPHSFLNNSKGIIRSKELENCSEQEITEELKSQGVISAYRIRIKKENTEISTNTIILTFNRCTPPKEIKAGFLNIRIEEYIPNPMRCHNCQKFGHLKKHCRNSLICPCCGQSGHDIDSCSSPMQCVNCEGQHMSFSKVCPKWLEEKEIQKIKVQRQITYQEARKVMQTQKSLTTEKNYAGAAKSGIIKTLKNIETQTPEFPELYYKDSNGIYKKWEGKIENEININTDRSVQTEQKTKSPMKFVTSNTSNKNDKKNKTLPTSQNKELLTNKNTSKNDTEKSNGKNVSGAALKIQLETEETNFTMLSPEKVTIKERNGTIDNNMEITEENPTGETTISKSKNKKTKISTHPAQSNIIKTLQKQN